MTAATEGYALKGFVHPLNDVREATPLGLIQDFVSAASKVSVMAELKKLVGDASQGLGFDYYALVQHVRFGVPSQHVRLTNYPVEWLAFGNPKLMPRKCKRMLSELNRQLKMRDPVEYMENEK